MKITICGSLKFHDQLVEIQKTLEKAGHTIYMPVKAEGVDYWAQDGAKRVEAKKGLDLIRKHMDKINTSDAILVANYTKHDQENYIGANTFGEMIYAHYIHKPIYLLNPKPEQLYIADEVDTMEPIVLNGDLNQLTSK